MRVVTGYRAVFPFSENKRYEFKSISLVGSSYLHGWSLSQHVKGQSQPNTKLPFSYSYSKFHLHHLREQIMSDALRLAFAVIFCLLLISFSASTSAQVDEVIEENPTFVVTGFIVNGDNPLSESETSGVLDRFTNRPLSIAELQEAANKLEEKLATKGYNFYRTALPPQTLDAGSVSLEIKKIDIGKVSVLGNQYFSNKNIKRSLPLIAEGRSPNTQKIATALLLAEQNPAKDVRVMFVKGDSPDSVNANITVKDKNPNDFYLWANNSGSRATSSSRLGLQYHNRNLWGLDHQVSLSYSTSPEDTSELSQYGLNYRFPLYNLGGQANVFYSKSDADTGRVADFFDISGAGETLGIGYTQYLDKRGDYQHRVGVSLVDKLFDSDVFFGAENIGQDVRTRPLSIDYISRFGKSNWAVNSVLSYSTNLSGGNFNDDVSYANSRVGATSSWNKQKLSIKYDYSWSQQWLGSVSLFAQNTSDVLVAGEKFGLGGSLGEAGPRGFYEREASVDKGVKFSLQANRLFRNGKYRLGAFLDYGTGMQNNVQVGENDKETLSSVGLTFNWNITPAMGLTLDYGYIIDGVETLDGQTDQVSVDGDDRLHVSFRYFPKWPFTSQGGVR